MRDVVVVVKKVAGWKMEMGTLRVSMKAAVSHRLLRNRLSSRAHFLDAFEART